MRKALLSLMVAACFAPVVFAQGTSAYEITTNSTLNWPQPTRLAMFEVTAQRALTINQIGIAFLLAGPMSVDVWIREGGYGVSAPTPAPLDNWIFKGNAQVHSDGGGSIHTIDVPLDIVLPPNETVGIAVVSQTSAGCFKQFRYNSPQPLPPIPSQDMHINLNGYGGTFVQATSGMFPSFSTYYTMPIAFHGTIYYDAGPTVFTNKTALQIPNTTPGNASMVAEYKVGGQLLTAGTTITAPTGVELSFNQFSGYTDTLNVGQFPTYADLSVYARIKNSASIGPISGNIVHSSAGAPDRNIAVSGSVISMTANKAALNLGWTIVGGPSAPQSFQLTGMSLSGPTQISAPAGMELAFNAAGPYSTTLSITATAYQTNVFVRLSGAVVGSYVGPVNALCAPAMITVVAEGNVFPPGNLTAVRYGPTVPVMVDNTVQGNGVVLLDFGLGTINEPWTTTSFTFSAQGTANVNTALNFVAMYEDSKVAGTQGVYDGPAIDTLASAVGTGFNSGSFTTSLINGEFPAWGVRRFFVVGKLAGTMAYDQTLKAELQSVVATTPGPGFLSGMPTTSSTPALKIIPGSLLVGVDGPTSYTTIYAGSQGAGNNGHVIANVTVTPVNNFWTVSRLNFTESGSINALTALNHLALYQDNGNGAWDGPQVDMIASGWAEASFDAPNGFYSALLSTEAAAFDVNETKRFFLVAKFSGTATPGQVLKVQLSEVVQSTNGGGDIIGVPSAVVSPVVVALASMTMSAGPANQPSVSIARDAAGGQAVLGTIRLTASVADFSVSGIKLTTGGNGNWNYSVDPNNGVQVYADNGDGVFGGSDVLLFSGRGTTPVVDCVFGSNVNIGTGTHADLWIVMNVLPTAGANPAETFTLKIADESDVTMTPADAYRIMGTAAPQASMLRVVDLHMNGITPDVAEIKGGVPFTIYGSGFTAPATVTIGGVLCPGTAEVNPAGTQVTGLLIPAGSGQDLPIVIDTNGLGPKTMSMTFSYSEVRTDVKEKDDQSCTATPVAGSLAMLFPAALGVIALRRRRS